MINRRRFVQTLGAIGSLGVFPTRADGKPAVIARSIPSTGERLPAIGMGSSRTFNVTLDDGTRGQLGEVLRLFFAGGGTLIDSSPMYGSAERVLGELLSETPGRERLFAATKVWTDGRAAGVEQMERSMGRMGVDRFDLMQIHNLRDWQEHLRTLKDWKERGRIRYHGITTSHGRAHGELARALEAEPFDFVQLSYSIGNRAVEQRLLPLARDRGVAVIANRPFERGSLFRKVRGSALPPWATDYGIQSWGQFFLKYVISHPNVTCAIPATSKPRHMRDNMGAGVGELPDATGRQRMETFFANL